MDEIDVQKETEELGEILDEFEIIKEMPNLPLEKFYPINRASRRLAEKQQKYTNNAIRSKGQQHGKTPM